MAKRRRRNDGVKTVDELGVEDFRISPVWAFTDEHEAELDETAVRPVPQLPVDDLEGKIVGTQVTLANGRRVWAIIGNVHVADPRRTEQFLALSLERNGEWFHVAGYSDFDFAERGPEQAAKFLGLSVDEAFPIAYDLRGFATGHERSLQGQVLKEPRERLSMEERFALIFPEPDAK